MASRNKFKIALLLFFAAFVAVWLVAGSLSAAVGTSSVDNGGDPSNVLPNTNQDDYVGSESCAACHENQFNNFSGTKHALLANRDGWKDKVQGCESCHGPGKAHVEGGGDKTQIVSFTGKTSKQISESCLACHAGKETHNNFRRGEHWRNDVGCTECHSAHGTQLGNIKASSLVQIADASNQNPTGAYMLKSNDPQLCIACHTETKAQFSKPFHHKVLEGTMKCSDCHNPHGGFESKQTKLSVGVDSACIKCHADKQGPFVFEHAPLKLEGCSSCHIPHGTSNPKMLKRPQVRQLCYECHSGITDQLSDGPTGGPHSQLTIRSTNCTVCHAAIHGSNTNSVFFR